MAVPTEPGPEERDGQGMRQREATPRIIRTWQETAGRIASPGMTEHRTIAVTTEVPQPIGPTIRIWQETAGRIARPGMTKHRTMAVTTEALQPIGPTIRIWQETAGRIASPGITEHRTMAVTTGAQMVTQVGRILLQQGLTRRPVPTDSSQRKEPRTRLGRA
jgi:hypothetical protein